MVLLLMRRRQPRLTLFPYIFIFNDTATTEIYTLSLHNALPICVRDSPPRTTRTADAAAASCRKSGIAEAPAEAIRPQGARSEEHTSELQSRQYLVCRLLLEKK